MKERRGDRAKGRRGDKKPRAVSTSPRLPASTSGSPLVAVIMGSTSDWETMRHAAEVLKRFGVPVESKALKGLDSLLSIVQMPAGIPVGTLAIGPGGATNAGLLAVAVLSNTRPELRESLRRFREEQTSKVREATLPS